MAALPADVAKYTQDGVVVSTDPVVGAAIKAAHPDARDGAETEIEMFWVDPNHAQVMLTEKFGYRSKVDPLHIGVEVEESLGLGTLVPLAPTVPSFQAVDESRGVDTPARTRAFARDTGTDRFSLELLE